ncbi:MAG: 50S ribosomal protein L4 [Candidatus Coatesbacteria bacterium]|nr:50S ribosomal protein L4 [Candidatus Coatesbacteria bacterium]
MLTFEVFNRDGESVGELELPLEELDGPTTTVSNVVRALHANRRRGTASTKTRAEVRGGGRKPWRQKGTGRARHGSRRSPIWRTGGITFGPRPRSYEQRLPKKVRRRALAEALGCRTTDIRILDEWRIDEPKTREVFRVLGNLDAREKPLLVTTDGDAVLWKSSRNIPGCRLTRVDDLNPHLVLWHGKLVFTRAAAERLAGKLGGDSR